LLGLELKNNFEPSEEFLKKKISMDIFFEFFKNDLKVFERQDVLETNFIILEEKKFPVCWKNSFLQVSSMDKFFGMLCEERKQLEF